MTLRDRKKEVEQERHTEKDMERKRDKVREINREGDGERKTKRESRIQQYNPHLDILHVAEIRSVVVD